ncbi:MAG: sigma-70 family RNA polymerase sigma factor [Planctomycetes bacterium]|nr:sigma-70 family RNA polymerase sigma factor [Planctomycetota bacterium]
MGGREKRRETGSYDGSMSPVDWARLYREFYPRVRARLLASVTDEHEAQDLAQQVFVELARTKVPEESLTYLNAIVRNLAAQYRRRRVAEQEALAEYLRHEEVAGAGAKWHDATADAPQIDSKEEFERLPGYWGQSPIMDYNEWLRILLGAGRRRRTGPATVTSRRRRAEREEAVQGSGSSSFLPPNAPFLAYPSAPFARKSPGRPCGPGMLLEEPGTSGSVGLSRFTASPSRTVRTLHTPLRKLGKLCTHPNFFLRMAGEGVRLSILLSVTHVFLSCVFSRFLRL